METLGNPMILEREPTTLAGTLEGPLKKGDDIRQVLKHKHC